MQTHRQIPPTVTVASATMLVVTGSTRSIASPTFVFDSAELNLIDRLLGPETLIQSVLGLVLISLLLLIR